LVGGAIAMVCAICCGWWCDCDGLCDFGWCLRAIVLVCAIAVVIWVGGGANSRASEASEGRVVVGACVPQ